MAWRPANSLPVLVAVLKPLAPDAPPGSFGYIGDAAHSSTSDHAPKDFPGWGSDIVTATDFPRHGDLYPRKVLDSIRKSKDPRVKYGISEGEMFSSYAVPGYPAWTWRPYSGADRHFSHGHLSVVGDSRADGTQPWQTGVDVLTRGQEAQLNNTEKEGAAIRDLTDTTSNLDNGVAKNVTIENKFVKAFKELRADVLALRADATAEKVRDAGFRAAFDALSAAIQAGGGSVDVAAIKSKIDESAASVKAEIEQEISVLRTENAALRDEVKAAKLAAQAGLSPSERSDLGLPES